MRDTEREPYSKIAELLGEKQPKEDEIHVTDSGVIVIETGEPNLRKLVEKAMLL